MAENGRIDECFADDGNGGAGMAIDFFDASVKVGDGCLGNLFGRGLPLLGPSGGVAFLQFLTEFGLDVRVVGEVFRAPACCSCGRVVAANEDAEELWSPAVSSLSKKERYVDQITSS